MPRLPRVSGKAVISALQRGGFRVERVSGSHHVLVGPVTRPAKAIVPVRGSHDLPIGTLRNIIEMSGLSIDEFIALL